MPMMKSAIERTISSEAVDEEYEKLQRFQVDHRRLVFIKHKERPEGGYGIVVRAELHASAYLPAWLASRLYGPQQLVAVKQIKVSRIYNVPSVKRAFTREMLVWSTVGAHPGIARFIGFYADFKRPEAWLISPWEPNGSISDFLLKHNLEVPEKLSLVYDTIDALTFLHELDPPVCHGDIKAANVLVSVNRKARLCDFGLARLHEDSGFGKLDTTTGNKGSIRWCSPELINGAKRAPTSDVYAWAWLVWEIMTGNVPYEETDSEYTIILKIFDSPLPELDGQSSLRDSLQLWYLMTRCWEFEPVRRPTARMCKSTITDLPRYTPYICGSVDEEFEKLKIFDIDRRRIVFVGSETMQGGFGVVRRADLHEPAYRPTWLGSVPYGPPQPVAVKQIKVKDFSTTPRMKRAFTREMLVWSRLEEHPGIAKFLGFHADFERSEAWLVSPWEPNGNVTEFLYEHNLEVPERLSLVYDTIDALSFLHQLRPPVCHGDLKSANVLVSADYKARLCDFGLARLDEDGGFGKLETSTGWKGSLRWCSPEIINGAPRAPSSDIYAWAWLVWEIMTGKLPYEGSSADYAIIMLIFENTVPQVDGESCLSDCLQIWELMKRCWNVDPTERPTARMCKATCTYLPRCVPTFAFTDFQTQSPMLLESLGDLESWKGNQEKSAVHLDEAMRLYQEDGDTNGIASVLLRQAAVADRIEDFAKSRGLATMALERYGTLKDTLGMAKASYYLGRSIWMLGEADEALPLLRQSLETLRTHGDDVGVVQCLERIANIQRAKGQVQDAVSTLDEAVGIARRSGVQLAQAYALQATGILHLELADFVNAANALSKTVIITRDIGWEGGLSNALRTMGSLKTHLGEYDEAEELLNESVFIARRIKSQFKLAQGLEVLAKCFRRQSKHNEAAPLLEEACLLYHGLSQEGMSKRTASTLVELKDGQGDRDGALFWLDHIIAVCRSRKEYRGMSKHLQQKGELLVKARRYDEAALHFEAAVATCRENGFSWLEERAQLRAIPKVVMTWERRLRLLCDVKKLQRRWPQLVTASLKFPISTGHGEL